MPSKDLSDQLAADGPEDSRKAVADPEAVEPDQAEAGAPVDAVEPESVATDTVATEPAATEPAAREPAATDANTADAGTAEAATAPAAEAPTEIIAAAETPATAHTEVGPTGPAATPAAGADPAPSKAGKTALIWVAALAVIAVIVYLITAVSAGTAPVASATPTAGAEGAPTASASAPAATASAAPATGDLSTVKVSGTDKPSITAAVPFAVAKTVTRVITPGTGKEIAKGQRITIDYLGVNGADGKTFDTSFGKTEPVSFILGDENLIKGMVTGLTGAKIGSRVLLAIPAAEGYGTNGAPDAGIGPTDTLLFLVDLKSAVTPPTALTRATGTAVTPKAGLPTVTLDGKTGAPTISVPKETAPTTLAVQSLINGKGATVAKGQTITVHYTGMIWGTGKVFDSSWTKGTPATFPIGTGNVIPGWDKGLVGKKVGSQILLVIPPGDGYGATGAPDAGISPTDTLIFVVDILAAS